MAVRQAALVRDESALEGMYFYISVCRSGGVNCTDLVRNGLVDEPRNVSVGFV